MLSFDYFNHFSIFAFAVIDRIVSWRSKTWFSPLTSGQSGTAPGPWVCGRATCSLWRGTEPTIRRCQVTGVHYGLLQSVGMHLKKTAVCLLYLGGGPLAKPRLLIRTVPFPPWRLLWEALIFTWQQLLVGTAAACWDISQLVGTVQIFTQPKQFLGAHCDSSQRWMHAQSVLILIQTLFYWP